MAVIRVGFGFQPNASASGRRRAEVDQRRFVPLLGLGKRRIDVFAPVDATSSFIHENFVPVAAHIKKRPVYFHRFDVLWTPTVLILDPRGVERRRSEDTPAPPGNTRTRAWRPKPFIGKGHAGTRRRTTTRNWARSRRAEGEVLGSVWALKASIWWS